MKSLLVRIFGFTATLIHGDTLVLDRWFWLKRRLGKIEPKGNLLDVGCGTGAFTIGSALMGFDSLGLSWDARNQSVAEFRARLCNASRASFSVQDVRALDERCDLYDRFEVVICLECIEHILNDEKLMIDMARCLKIGGQLLLTSPSENYIPITKGDNGPWSVTEDGWHVRKGYTEARYRELCQKAGLSFVSSSMCAGVLSQKLTSIFRTLGGIHPLIGWCFILIFRPFPIVFDRLFTSLLGWPYYTLCLEARKL